MNKNEYLDKIVKIFNANPNDEALSGVEKTLLSKISIAEKSWAELAKQLSDLEKDINQKTAELSEIRAQMIREKGRSDAFVESLFSLEASDVE